MSTIKTIYVFRHGETDWNKQERFQGRVDIPLNEKGRAQADGLRAFFKANPVEVCLCSDLGRAQETARLALADLDVPIITEPRIRETNLGDVEGMTHQEIRDKMGVELIDNWRSIAAHHDEARFPNGESKREHRERVVAGIEDFLKTTTCTHIAVSTHGGSLRRLLHHLRPELTEAVMIGNCVLYEIQYDTAKAHFSVDLIPKSVSK